MIEQTKTATPSPNLLETQSAVTPTSGLKDQQPTGITLRVAAAMLPLEPSQVTVERITGTAVVKWRGTGEGGIEYEVYRRPSGIQDWQQLGTIEMIGDNRGEYEFRDTIPWSGAYDNYTYGVASRSSYGRRSYTISESTAITTP